MLEEPRSPIDEAVLANSYEQTGAVVMGRRLYDIVDGPHGWSDDVGYGHDQNQSAAPPCYVITHEAMSSPTNRPPRCGSYPGSGS